MKSLQNISITEIDEAFTVASPKGRQLQIKNRYCYGLTFCESGQITYFHNGQQFTSDTEHALLLPMGETWDM